MGDCGTVFTMKRLFLILTVVSLFVAACSGAAVEDKAGTDEAPLTVSSSSTPAETPAETPADSSAPSSSSPEESTSSSVTKPPLEGPAAPDFTLALEPNGEFVLSQEVNPVYMVFWAEW